jgi:hypothetical protein
LASIAKEEISCVRRDNCAGLERKAHAGLPRLL